MRGHLKNSRERACALAGASSNINRLALHPRPALHLQADVHLTSLTGGSRTAAPCKLIPIMERDGEGEGDRDGRRVAGGTKSPSGRTIHSHHKLKQEPTSRRQSERDSSTRLCPRTRPEALSWYNRRTLLGAGRVHLRGNASKGECGPALPKTPPTPALSSLHPPPSTSQHTSPHVHAPVHSRHSPTASAYSLHIKNPVCLQTHALPT